MIVKGNLWRNPDSSEWIDRTRPSSSMFTTLRGQGCVNDGKRKHLSAPHTVPLLCAANPKMMPSHATDRGEQTQTVYSWEWSIWTRRALAAIASHRTLQSETNPIVSTVGNGRKHYCGSTFCSFLLLRWLWHRHAGQHLAIVWCRCLGESMLCRPPESHQIMFSAFSNSIYDAAKLAFLRKELDRTASFEPLASGWSAFALLQYPLASVAQDRAGSWLPPDCPGLFLRRVAHSIHFTDVNDSSVLPSWHLIGKSTTIQQYRSRNRIWNLTSRITSSLASKQ